VEALRYAKMGYSLLLIGHQGHEEVEGTMGEAPASIQLVQNVEEARRVPVADPEKVAVITQTTLSVDDTKEIIDALRQRFPKLLVPSKDDICYATQNRQNAVKAIAQAVEVVLVIGAKNSSNSIRLTEVAEDAGRRAHLINDAGEIQPAWFDGVTAVGVTSGASAPEHLVQDVVAKLRELGASQIEEWELVHEDVSFGLPTELAVTRLPS
jgi:4-hydroxy-3-methylbut-2-enyl diphosphate reductase